MLLGRRTVCTLCNCLRLVKHTTRVISHSLGPWTGMKRSATGNGVMLRHLRYRAKLGGELEPPGVIELAVIGSGVNGSPKSFVVNTDHIR